MIKQDVPALVPTTRWSSGLCMTVVRLSDMHTGISLESSCCDAKSQLSKALTHKHMCTMFLRVTLFLFSLPWLIIHLLCLLLSVIFPFDIMTSLQECIWSFILFVGLQWLHVQHVSAATSHIWFHHVICEEYLKLCNIIFIFLFLLYINLNVWGIHLFYLIQNWLPDGVKVEGTAYCSITNFF